MSTNTIRLDKWLWQARFLKSRSLAAKLCAGSRVRVNRRPATKPSAQVRTGDVLTFPLGNHIRVVRIVALGSRRGPAVEARALYEDMSEPPPSPPPAAALRDRGSGRPTKADRRAIDRLDRLR